MTWTGGLATGVALLLLGGGCSSAARHDVLCFFFTGVDRPNSLPVSTVVHATTNEATALSVSAPVEYIHKPYLERDCAACHVSAESQELRAQGEALCFECHKTLIGNAKYVHAPVAAGQCELCHEPHKSPERFLLRHKSQELCLDCHSMPLMMEIRAHGNMGQKSCVECHDPHRSDRPKLEKSRP